MSDHSTADHLHNADAPTSLPSAPHEQQLLRQAGDVIENLRSQLAELDRREQNVTVQTTAIENESRRQRLSAQQSEDRAAERESVLNDREESIEQQLTEIDALKRRHEDERAELQMLREELASDRARLRDELEAELETQRDELNREREAHEQKKVEYDEKWTLGLASLDEDLGKERESRRSVIEAELLQLAETVAAEETSFGEERSRRHTEFEAEQATQQEQLATLSAELKSVRETKLDDIEQRENELQRQQVDLEKRTRFHETHLDQLRQSHEQRQADFDRQHQLTRAEHVQVASWQAVHLRQLRRYRDQLTQREQSLDRERHLVDDARRAFDTKRNEELARVESERETWEQEREAHRADMRRQQDMLALHAQNLEARRIRLDQLRDDLEKTHRKTLEMRLVVEQVWAQLSQTFGEETTRKRVEQARAELVEGYEKLRGSLVEQQQDIDAAEQRLSEQRERFRVEREEFTVWMSENEATIERRERLLHQDLEAAEASEAQWKSTRERWTLEKIEAESVIRQLLEELDADITPPPTALPLAAMEERDEPRDDIDESSAAA